MSSADTRAFETLKGFNNEKFNAIIVRSLSNNIPDFPMKKKRGGGDIWKEQKPIDCRNSITASNNHYKDLIDCIVHNTCLNIKKFDTTIYLHSFTEKKR